VPISNAVPIFNFLHAGHKQDRKAYVYLRLNAEILSRKGYSFNLNKTYLDKLFIPTLAQLASDFFCCGNSSLTSLSVPELVSMGGYFYCVNNASLTSLSLPVLARVGGYFACYNHASLTTVDLSSYLPTNDTYQDFSGSALTAASVNHILARCVANPAYVSGAVHLNSGTNAAPTGQGITDVATLRRRGVTVTIN